MKSAEQVFEEHYDGLMDAGTLWQAIIPAMEAYHAQFAQPAQEGYSRVQMEVCHMEGQLSAGCKHPSTSEAIAYVSTSLPAPSAQPKEDYVTFEDLAITASEMEWPDNIMDDIKKLVRTPSAQVSEEVEDRIDELESVNADKRLNDNGRTK